LPPESGSQPVFFVDASLGGRIVPEALRDAGATVVAHDEKFRPGTPDEKWLKAAGAHGWAVLTKDQRIRYRASERRSLEVAGVAAFVLSAKNQTGEQMAASLVAALPRMKRLLTAQQRPFIAVVSASGAVRVLD